VDSDENGIFFNELLFGAMRRVHGKDKHKVVFNQELQCLKKIQIKSDKASKKSYYGGTRVFALI
jgi:hypothetical protein